MAWVFPRARAGRIKIRARGAIVGTEMVDWVFVSLLTTFMAVVKVGTFYTANLEENLRVEAREPRDRKLK